MENEQEPKQYSSGWEVLREKLIEMEEYKAKELGHWDEYLKLQTLDGFGEARELWFSAWGELFRKQHHDVFASDSATLDEARNLFFIYLTCDPVAALKRDIWIIQDAASKGDLEFFMRISTELRNAERRKGKMPLAFDILSFWFSGLLWLMDDKLAHFVLGKYTNVPSMTTDSYIKEKQRLGLKGFKYLNMPLIKDYDSGTRKFTFESNWTELVTNLSKASD